MAARGPLEVLVMAFPGEGLPDGAGSALEQIQEDGSIRVIEALLIVKSSPGTVRSEEVTDLMAVADLATDYGADVPTGGLVSAEDIDDIGAAMQMDTTALALVLEHRWARDFMTAFHDVGGVVLASSMVPDATRSTARLRFTGSGRRPM
jgi:hypothetical protein